jgi:hypothetical protein
MPAAIITKHFSIISVCFTTGTGNANTIKGEHLYLLASMCTEHSTTTLGITSIFCYVYHCRACDYSNWQKQIWSLPLWFISWYNWFGSCNSFLHCLQCRHCHSSTAHLKILTREEHAKLAHILLGTLTFILGVVAASTGLNKSEFKLIMYSTVRLIYNTVTNSLTCHSWRCNKKILLKKDSFCFWKTWENRTNWYLWEI